jgi:hypothetical protein
MPERIRSLRRRAAIAWIWLLAGVAAGCGKSEAAATESAHAGLSLRAGDGGADGGAPDSPGMPAPADDSALPAAESEELTSRMRHLVDALAHQNPDLARDVVFPRDAYLALRDVSDPASGWERRVAQPFRAAVERAHRRNPDIERATFLSFEIGSTIVSVPPRKKEWKKPLWTVKRSRLTFLVDKKPHTVEIAEMTAWRGAWYITRLR